MKPNSGSRGSIKPNPTRSAEPDESGKVATEELDFTRFRVVTESGILAVFDAADEWDGRDEPASQLAYWNDFATQQFFFFDQLLFTDGDVLQSVAAMVRDLAIDPALLFAEKPELSPLPEITLPGQWIPAHETVVLAVMNGGQAAQAEGETAGLISPCAPGGLCDPQAMAATGPIPGPVRGTPSEQLFGMASAGAKCNCNGGGPGPIPCINCSCDPDCCLENNRCCGDTDCCFSPDPCCDGGDLCCGNADRCCNSDNPCCENCDPCCNTNDECCGDSNRCCNFDNPCCESNDPCCNKSDPCCGNSDRCCNADNPCCNSDDPCCNPGDPCCGDSDRCCNADNPCCNSDDPCCNPSDPCCGDFDECCNEDNPCCGTEDGPCCMSDDPCCNDPTCDMDNDGIPDRDDQDVDGDGLLNIDDPDIDNDGLPNGDDPNVDGDGMDNGDDPDVDGDGEVNGEDSDVNGDGESNGEDTDVDGDGELNGADSDVDGDGIENGADSDVDGDGSTNGEDTNVDGDEVANGQDDDVDGDGVDNDTDDDADGDGVPNSIDGDVDGDGISNEEDPTPIGCAGACCGSFDICCGMPDGLICDDGNSCTILDACSNNACIGIMCPGICCDSVCCAEEEVCCGGHCCPSEDCCDEVCCSMPAAQTAGAAACCEASPCDPPDCDDANICTYDKCNTASGECKNTRRIDLKIQGNAPSLAALDEAHEDQLLGKIMCPDSLVVPPQITATFNLTGIASADKGSAILSLEAGNSAMLAVDDETNFQTPLTLSYPINFGSNTPAVLSRVFHLKALSHGTVVLRVTWNSPELGASCFDEVRVTIRPLWTTTSFPGVTFSAPGADPTFDPVAPRKIATPTKAGLGDGVQEAIEWAPSVDVQSNNSDFPCSHFTVGIIQNLRTHDVVFSYGEKDVRHYIPTPILDKQPNSPPPFYVSNSIRKINQCGTAGPLTFDDTPNEYSKWTNPCPNQGGNLTGITYQKNFETWLGTVSKPDFPV